MMQKCNGSSGRWLGGVEGPCRKDVCLRKSHMKTNVGTTKVDVTMAVGLFCLRQLGAEQ